jgi:hypothetical protein
MALGYPIRRPKPENLLFEETWCTGYPSFSAGFFIVGQRCMWVHVGDEIVTVRMHFPFCIFLVPEAFGLGWEFRRTDLLGCSKTAMGVRVRYQGRWLEREFVLHVSEKNRLLEALDSSKSVD